MRTRAATADVQGPVMIQITIAMRQLASLDRAYRWQINVTGALATGSLSAAILQGGGMLVEWLCRKAFAPATNAQLSGSTHA